MAMATGAHRARLDALVGCRGTTTAYPCGGGQECVVVEVVHAPPTGSLWPRGMTWLNCRWRGKRRAGLWMFPHEFTPNAHLTGPNGPGGSHD